MEQVFAHLIGDYFLQTDWMALNKKHNFFIALLHAIVYTIPFLLITQSILALLVICITHAIIDGTFIINKFNQIKNWYWETEYGYHKDRPSFIWVWLSIIQDNTLHLIINYYAIKYLG